MKGNKGILLEGVEIVVVVSTTTMAGLNWTEVVMDRTNPKRMVWDMKISPQMMSHVVTL